MKDFHRVTQQQSDGIDQVSRAVSEMEKVAKQNHALVESMSQASDQLRSQGMQLMTAVDLFQLEADAAA